MKEMLRRAIEETYIPPNEHKIRPGYYSRARLVRLLRAKRRNPAAILFIADMME